MWTVVTHAARVRRGLPDVVSRRKKIAFQAVAAPGQLREIFVINVDGTDLTNSRTIPRMTIGRLVAGRSQDSVHEQPGRTRADLCHERDGSNVTRLTFTEAARDLAPDWSQTAGGSYSKATGTTPTSRHRPAGFDIYS